MRHLQLAPERVREDARVIARTRELQKQHESKERRSLGVPCELGKLRKGRTDLFDSGDPPGLLSALEPEAVEALARALADAND